MKTLAVLLALLWIQDKNEAAVLLEKSEATLRAAKSLSLKCTLAFVEDGQDSGKVDIELIVEGSKCRISSSGQNNGKDRSNTFVSDGTTLKIVGTRPAELVPPKALALGLVLLLSRTGFSMGIDSLIREEKEGKALDPEGLFGVSGAAAAPAEKIGETEYQVVTYSMAIQGTSRKATVKVWIDPATSLPRRRRLDPGKGKSIVEDYADLKLDAKIDPSRFELPK